MPRFDGTGPNGQGSMTGGRRGYCKSNTQFIPQWGSGFYGLGRGLRQRRGHRGRGRSYSGMEQR